MKVGPRYRNRRECSQWLVLTDWRLSEGSAPFLHTGTPMRTHAHMHMPGRTPALQKDCFLVVLSDLLSFPRQGVDTSWSSLLESSRALPGRGREGSLSSRSWEAQRSSAFFWPGIDAGWGLCCNVLGRFWGIGQEWLMESLARSWFKSRSLKSPFHSVSQQQYFLTAYPCALHCSRYCERSQRSWGHHIRLFYKEC